MFKLASPVDRFLFVKGHLVWHIRPSLDSEKELVRSGGAMRRCPAHPCNFSLHMGLVSIDNWQFDKVGDYRNTSFEEGGVLVRCSVHDAEHGKWLVQQGREGLMEKERAGKLLCEEDKEGGFLLFFSDGDTQIEAGLWNREATENIAHKLSAHFHQWLIKEASEGRWSKEAVGSIVCKRNSDNQLILATLDFTTQQEVAFWNPEAVNRIAHLVGKQFVQWLFMQAKEGKWDEEEVDSVLFRENKRGSITLSALDFDTQKKVANKNKQKVNEVAHLMSAEFCQWLIQMAYEGKWSKEAVGDVTCRRNADNQLILGTLDEETQKRAAEFNKSRTCDVLCDMDKGGFLEWLYQEAEDGRWDRAMVFGALTRERIDGEFVISAKQIETAMDKR